MFYYDNNFMFDFDYEDFLATEAWADTFTLELFSDGISRYEGAEPFQGDTFSLRIYDHKLDAAAVAQNYAAGLPQTPALAYAVEATINEDGFPTPLRAATSAPTAVTRVRSSGGRW